MFLAGGIKESSQVEKLHSSYGDSHTDAFVVFALIFFKDSVNKL